MDPFVFIKKLFISGYAVEVCRELNLIDLQNCCGCKTSSSSTSCMMLPEDEKIEKIEDQYNAENQAKKAKIRP